MTWWQAVFLGIIQGLTEFLPVSSSGHLAIFENFFTLPEATITFDIMLHLGTLIAVIVYFRQQLLEIKKDLIIKIVVATLPLVAAGFFLKPLVESLRGDLPTLAFTYAITAGLLLLADRLMVAEKESKTWSLLTKLHAWVTGEHSPSMLQAFLVGIFQILAVLPGISRSGTTIAAGVISGVPAETAFRFAFLISIPAVLGAVSLDLLDVMQAGQLSSLPWGVYLLGATVSGVVGWGALAILKWFVSQRKLWPFAIYCAFVSILLVFFA